MHLSHLPNSEHSSSFSSSKSIFKRRSLIISLKLKKTNPLVKFCSVFCVFIFVRHVFFHFFSFAFSHSPTKVRRTRSISSLFWGVYRDHTHSIEKTFHLRMFRIIINVLKVDCGRSRMRGYLISSRFFCVLVCVLRFSLQTCLSSCIAPGRKNCSCNLFDILPVLNLYSQFIQKAEEIVNYQNFWGRWRFMIMNFIIYFGGSL